MRPLLLEAEDYIKNSSYRAYQITLGRVINLEPGKPRDSKTRYFSREILIITSRTRSVTRFLSITRFELTMV